MCHHNDHFRPYEQNEYGDQRRHEQASHGSYHFVWFLFPFLFSPFFAFHAWNAFGVLFWVAPIILFALGMKAASCKSHRQEAPAVPKDAPFYTPLLSRSDEQYAQPLLLEPYVQEDVAQQERIQQGEQEEYSSPFADEQPQVYSPQEIPTQERVR